MALALLAMGCFPGWGDVSLAVGRVLSALPPCCSQGSSQTPAAALASRLCCGLARRVLCLSFPIFTKAAPHPGGWWGHPGKRLSPHPKGFGQRRYLGELRHWGCECVCRKAASGPGLSQCWVSVPAPPPSGAGCAATGYHPHGIFTPSLHPMHAAPQFGPGNTNFCWR